MKKLYLFGTACIIFSFSQAQSVITVAPGTDMVFSSGTDFSIGGLYFQPSAGFTITNTSLTTNTTTTHFTANNYVTKVYKFSSTMNPFTGVIRFYYNDGQLNGLTESSLRVNIHNGTNWQAFNSTTNDVANNYVETVALSNQLINELALADQFAALPLKWGAVSAYRRQQTIKIDWNTKSENHVSHFTVEKSKDGIRWTTVVDGIIAHNLAGEQQYSTTDNEYEPLRVLYRIRHTDFDGRSSYSSVVAVAGVNESQDFLVYPNPVHAGFSILNMDPANVRQVFLYTNSGVQIRTWTTAQVSYQVQDMPAGIYRIQVKLKDGTTRHFTLNKQ